MLPEPFFAVVRPPFGVVRSVLMEPLPYGEPDRVVTIWSKWVGFLPPPPSRRGTSYEPASFVR